MRQHLGLLPPDTVVNEATVLQETLAKLKEPTKTGFNTSTSPASASNPSHTFDLARSVLSATSAQLKMSPKRFSYFVMAAFRCRHCPARTVPRGVKGCAHGSGAKVATALRHKGSLKVLLDSLSICTIQFSQNPDRLSPTELKCRPKSLHQWPLSPSSRAALLPNTSTGVVGDRPFRPFSADSGRARTASAACQP